MLEKKLKAKFAVTFGFVWLTLGWFAGAKADNYWALGVGHRALLIPRYRNLIAVNQPNTLLLNIARQSGVSYAQMGAAKQLTANFYAAKAVVSVHRHPSEESEMVTQALHGEPVRVLRRQNSWVQVSLPDQFDYRGWVRASDLASISSGRQWEKRSIVSVARASVRTLPRPDAPAFLVLPLGTVVGAGARADGNFTLVELVDGRQGYILSRELLDYSQQNRERVSGERILETARHLLGQPYLWGGMTTAGVDCSGFAHTVFKVHGIRLHRDADQQYFSDGISIPPDQLQPGDLVFFETYTSGPSHLGIYAGNGKFIQASSTAGVIYSSLDAPDFSERFLGAKRILRRR
ncbi:MAG: C40 family peptidase [Oscillatoria princeps RMCB-10]|jgi:uncharacterized protein YgiM (DUF1202 family)|nr:C40 family peptidase [Oscillatoria princeps RMCB-10]